MKRGRALPLLAFFGTEPIDSARSKIMSRVRGKDTKPELALRRALSAIGVRYRLHAPTLPGRPDIAHQGAKVAVFVDGCFWHGCPEHFRLPKTRTDFWNEKIRRNKATRRRILKEYPDDWRIFELFECDVSANLTKRAEEIGRAIRTE